jgi:hypothetical protein
MPHPEDSSSDPASVEPLRSSAAARAGLLALILFHLAVCCLSLVKVSEHEPYMLYDPRHLAYAIAICAAFALVSVLFVVARFSFGYFTGFYLYTMLMGFLWLSSFTKFHYDTRLAALSAAVSAILFLLPALLINSPVKQLFSPSRRQFEWVLALILVLTVATIAGAALYNFRLVSLTHIYEFRDELQFPLIVRYLVGLVPTALLPFAFASYLALRSYWKAAFALLLFPLFYPVTLSKLMFFSPGWILGLAVLTWMFEARKIVVLSLFVPIFTGVALMIGVGNDHALQYFNFVNIRMIATPSSALDFYNDFFAGHPHTWFCQISFVKALVGCPYQEPLAIVMQQTYRIGNLNASLFATEGVASVGLYMAPLTAFACGLVIAIGNRLSFGLPARFILVSAALLSQILLNVPLTITMVTYGAGPLFLLWYITPRSIFEPDSA